MAVPRIFLDKQTGKIRTALFSNGVEELFDVFTGKLKLLREVIIAYVTAGRVLDYSTKVGALGIIDQSPEGNNATLYSGRGATLDAAANTITYATGYSSAERTATVWMRVDGLGARTLNGATGTFTFTPTATGIWEELSDTQTVSGDLSWTAGSDCDIGDLTCADEHWTHDDWSNPTGDTSNGKTIVDSGPNDYHGTCTGCAGFTGEGIDPDVAGIVGCDDYVWFDGTSDYINKATDLPIANTSEGFDIEFDVLSDWAATYRFVAINNSSTYRIDLVGNQVSVYMGGSAAAVTRAFFNIGGTLKRGSFQNFRFTYDGSAVVSLYLDGSIFGSMTLSGAINTPVTSVRLGASASGTFTGSIKNLTFGSWIAEGNGVTSNEWGGATVNGTPITVGQKRATIPQTADRNWNKYMWFDGVDDAVTPTAAITLAVGEFIEIAGLIGTGLQFSVRANDAVGHDFLSITDSTFRLRVGEVIYTHPDTPITGINTVRATRTGASEYTLTLNGISEVLATVNAALVIDDFMVAMGIGLYIKGLLLSVNYNDVSSWTNKGTADADWEDETGANNATVAGTPEAMLVSASDANDQIDALGNPILEPRLNNQQLNPFGEGEYSLTPDSDSLDVTTAATWELWGNFYGAVSGGDQSYFSKYDTGGDQRSWYFYKADDSLADELNIRITSSGTTPAEQTVTSIPDSVSQIVLTLTGGVYAFYIDGVFSSTPAGLSSPVFASTAPIQIGCINIAGSPTQFAQGKIGSAKIYNVALTADEVLQNFNAQKSKYGL